MNDFLNDNLETSEKSLQFTGDGIHTVEIRKHVIVDVNDQGTQKSFMVFELDIIDSTDDEVQPGATYGLVKSKGTRMATDMFLNILAAVEGKPVTDARYRGSQEVELTDYDAKAKKVITTKEIKKAVNCRYAEVFADDAALAKTDLERLDLTGKQFILETKLGPVQPETSKWAGRQFIEFTYKPLKAKVKAKTSTKVQAPAAEVSSDEAGVFPGDE